MGVYRDRILPRLLDISLATPELARWRRQCVAGLAGAVIEPGFGSGLNVPLYPADVTEVYAVDPSGRSLELASARLAASPVKVTHVGDDAAELPLDDTTCDAGLVTFTLCTLPDPAGALKELHRVIKPGGWLHFLEHGASPDPGVHRWQRRLEPLQRRLFDGCHLTRDTEDLVRTAGFIDLEVRSSYALGFKPSAWFTVGRARRPG